MTTILQTTRFSPEADAVPAEVDESTVSDQRSIEELASHLGVRFQDLGLLRAGLTHPSYANEHPEDPTGDYERLEFLGDSVLGMIVARTLYQWFPGAPEGRLTEWRSHLVCGPTLSRVARSLSLGEWLRLGRGEEQTGGRGREGNLERVYEAVVGALYLDQGLDETRSFVLRTLESEFDALEAGPDALNPKGALQELVQRLAQELADSSTDRTASEPMSGRPEYALLSESGPDHAREFEVEVLINGESLGQGGGASKQQAEKEAAAEALAVLRTRLKQIDRGRAESSGDWQVAEREGGT
ncbi:MAG: ribonuclease III [Dehalococcoidia bacterium]|nr:ribonuclease III [Dehalococcoidia bacterium]